MIETQYTAHEVHWAECGVSLVRLFAIICVQFRCVMMPGASSELFLQQFIDFVICNNFDYLHCCRYFVSPDHFHGNLPCNFISISSSAVRYYTYHGFRVRIVLPVPSSLKYPIKVRSVYQFKYVSDVCLLWFYL